MGSATSWELLQWIPVTEKKTSQPLRLSYTTYKDCDIFAQPSCHVKTDVSLTKLITNLYYILYRKVKNKQYKMITFTVTNILIIKKLCTELLDGT